MAHYRKEFRLAHAKATQHIKPGDKITRTMCGGKTGTFTFTHWSGYWACGKTVSDCGPASITKVNGIPVAFYSEGFFGKQLQGIKIVFASWLPDKGMPDAPEHWNRCLFRLQDGSKYIVPKEELKGHHWKWV